MKRNSWAARLVYGLTLWLSGAAHQALVSSVSNTPEGMLVYHMTAALTDYMLLVCASSLLAERLAYDMQTLCLFAMVANFAGWILYMAYSPPSLYNYAITGLTYVQFARLITVGLYGIDRVGNSIVRRPDSVGPQLYAKETK